MTILSVEICFSDHFTSKPSVEYIVEPTEGSINIVTAKSHMSPSPPLPSSMFNVVEGMVNRSSYRYAINGEPYMNMHWDLLINSPAAPVGNEKSLGNLEGVFSIGRHYGRVGISSKSSNLSRK